MDDAAGSAIARLLTRFVEASDDRLDAEFDRLVEAVWCAGELTPAAGDATPALVDAFDRVSLRHQGYLAILLGLLVEAQARTPGHGIHDAVRGGLDRYLRVLREHGKAGEPSTLALLYLVAHFPADRERVLAGTAHLALSEPDRTRLDRSLQELDLTDPDIGRAWPSPAEWAISEEEREFDRGWIRTLSEEQIRKTWDGDTRSVLAYSGAQAYWAVRHRSPITLVADDSPFNEVVETDPKDLEPAAFARHAAAFRCIECRSPLRVDGATVNCTSCTATYSIRHGVLDLSGRVRAGAGISDAPEDVEADVLQNAAVLRGIGFHYEQGMRPNFLRVMGRNWDGTVTPAVEDGYITEQLTHTGGIVLDLAAGAGRWTAVVAKAVGAERVLALDLNDAMLYDLRSRLPEVPAIRASALDLPFADASIDAINCWNALQALPDPARALAEVGRCLRPGGVLTMMTFRWGDEPIYRYFQASHHFPARPDGFPLFELDEIRTWLANAGLVVRHEYYPGSFVFVTAQRVD
jgi:SAM-dependent methyltransferase